MPKAIELYATADIPDLSSYGVGFANNGGGSDGVEFTFPPEASAVTAGSYITVSSEEPQFLAYFGEAPDFVSGSAGINGDDAIELFFNGQVVDTYGDVNVDGTGQAWDYMDGWSYRRDASSPNAVFNIADWMLSGVNAVDSCPSNAACTSVFPFHTYQHSIASPTPPPTMSPTPPVSDCPYASYGNPLSSSARCNYVSSSLLIVIFCSICHI